MAYEIKKAAVLGAGVMGATIAAHLTNAGIECVLLDIIPFELTDADKAQGLTEKSPAWRNRFAANGLDGVLKSKPAGFYTKKMPPWSEWAILKTISAGWPMSTGSSKSSSRT